MPKKKKSTPVVSAAKRLVGRPRKILAASVSSSVLSPMAGTTSPQEKDCPVSTNPNRDEILTPLIVETQIPNSIPERAADVAVAEEDRLDNRLDAGTQEQVQSAQTDGLDTTISPETEKSAPVLWVDIIRENRTPDRGMTIAYTPPIVTGGDVVVEIQDEDIETELEFWKNALIMYVADNSLSMNAVKNFMTKIWSSIALPELYFNGDGFFIIRFHSANDKKLIEDGGPYYIYGRPMILRPWTRKFELKEDMLRLAQIWVKFPQLPLYLWGS